MARPGELFVMSRVPQALRDAGLGVLREAGLDTVLGEALYPLRNWHQSLSDLHAREARESMRRACAAVVAEAFEMRLDRLESSVHRRIHWQFVPSAGRPEGLGRLMAAVRGQLRAQGLVEAQGHRPHVTVSYRANRSIEPLTFAPLIWQIDTIELVEVAGHGNNYRYDVVDAWQLRPPVAPPAQLDLLQ
ncbi:2'-5' RNA ligase family protein [Pseudoxanthomonas daejeonensis]|uniref:2'-5' RNA ligase family protein n=1 Tax=Pseudoxanthomonas daejeonensis TaxID=266062 RepID=UPI001F54320A|nr:2'-5' RNA ligase family protein [Pseudoxanthomonas daejeonensis]UNK58387.1 2'-5' RNA ligase family protein [Pseudoxanthomonas daejeonensis]